MPLYIAQSGDLVRCHASLTESVTLTDSHLKDSATQLLIKYKSEALVTQLYSWHCANWLILCSTTKMDSLKLSRHEQFPCEIRLH